MAAVKENLYIEQGVTFARGWLVRYSADGNNFSPIDSSWVGKAQIRRYITDAVPLHEFTVNVSAQGAVTISVTAAESLAWSWSDEAVYSVKVHNADNSVSLRVAEGKVMVSPEVTR